MIQAPRKRPYVCVRPQKICKAENAAAPITNETMGFIRPNENKISHRWLNRVRLGVNVCKSWKVKPYVGQRLAASPG